MFSSLTAETIASMDETSLMYAMIMLASLPSSVRVIFESRLSNLGNFRTLSTVLQLGCFSRATSDDSNYGSVLVWLNVIFSTINRIRASKHSLWIPMLDLQSPRVL